MNIYRLSVLSCLAMVTPPALAAEFNLNVLDKSIRDSVDISLLNQKGVVAPGDYFVSVTVNNNKISNGQQIRWQKSGDKIIPCINESLIELFELKSDFRKKLPAIKECVDFSVFPEIILLSIRQINSSILQSRRHGWRGIQKTGRHPQRGITVFLAS